jgi:hypothetical protein
MSREDGFQYRSDGQPTPHAGLTRVLLEASSVILRAPDEQTLFDRVCRLLIDVGGFRFAWVGLLEPTGDRFNESALAAPDSETREAVREFARSEQGRMALTRRIKDREAWVINLLAEREAVDPDSPWTGLAIRLGTGSVAHLPIAANRLVHGLLVIASDDADDLTPERIRGLERISSDLAIKLDWLGRRATGVVSHEGTFQARARAFFDLAPQAILLVLNDTVETNETFVKMFGADRRHSDLSRFFAPGVWTYMVELNRRRLAGRASLDRYRAVGVRTDGTHFPILVQVTTVDLEAGQAQALFITDLSPDVR